MKADDQMPLDPTDDHAELRIDYEKLSKQRVELTVRLGGHLRHKDVLSLGNSGARAKFARVVADKLHLEQSAIEQDLLDIADELGGGPEADPEEDDLPTFTNAAADGRGLMIVEIAAALLALTGGWPRRVGGELFAEGADGRPDAIRSATDLFAWIRRHARVVWRRGDDKVPQHEFHAHLLRAAEAFDAVERVPHWPPVAGIYYMTPELPESDGSHLELLLDAFRPATPVDRALLKAYLMTLGWGGAPGARPAFLFTGPEVDEQRGRGVGKTTFATITAPLFGGFLHAGAKEDMPAIVKRLLSPEGRGKRVVLLDNVKTHRFSWAELEAFITSPVISGHEMYHGEGQRPNTTTVAITVNGASLSKDLAQRAVVVRLARPDHVADWAKTVAGYIADRRAEILADLGRLLTSGATATFSRPSRWAAWEAEVLAKVEAPQACQAAILQRQALVDDDASEAEMVVDQFRAELTRRGLDPATSYVLVPRPLARTWLEVALGEPLKMSKARAVLNGMGIPQLHESASDGTRGWCWTGPHAVTTGGMTVVAG